jgi:hypothetical protein
MKRSIAWLWLIGAALYAISTWLFADVVSVVGRNDQNSISSSTTSPSPLPVAPVSEKVEDVAEDRTESPAPEAPLALGLPEDDEHSTEKPEAPGATSNAVQAERLVVRSAANIRNGPSSKSTLIGTAPVGAELEVAEREGGWVRFVDPATSHTGWIYEGLLTPLRSESGPPTIERPITASAGEAVKPKARVHTRNMARPVASRRAPKQQVGSRPFLSGYAQLPSDEDFRPNKRRLGFLARRRMLREGLLSEDFTPR